MTAHPRVVLRLPICNLLRFPISSTEGLGKLGIPRDEKQGRVGFIELPKQPALGKESVRAYNRKRSTTGRSGGSALLSDWDIGGLP